MTEWFLTFSNFAEKLPKNSNFDDVSKRLARNHFKEMPMDLLEMYDSKVKTDIDNYTGHYIFDRQPGNEAVYMWDNEKESLELLCELKKEIHLI